VAFGEVYVGGGGFHRGVSGGGGYESGSEYVTIFASRSTLFLNWQPRETFRFVILEWWCC
jgi:hypothetical protein